MLAFALLTAFLLLCVAWFCHFIIWRVHIPVAYPYWIVSIFAMVFIAYSCYNLYQIDQLNNVILWLLAVAIPYAMAGGAYLMVYAGINEYSPSVEILLEIKKYMPQGVLIREFSVKTLPETMLTGLRLQHLLDGKMIAKINNQYVITPKGNRYASIVYWYRKCLWIDFPGKG